MHTLRITLIGLILLSLFVFVAAQINQRKTALFERRPSGPHSTAGHFHVFAIAKT